MKNILNILTLALTFTIGFSQVGINTATVNNSAMLEVSNSTSQAVIFPQVILTDVVTVSPITGGTPEEGMIVYNTGGALEKGYYLWINGTWTPLADKDNTVRNAFYLFDNTTTPYVFMPGVANNTYTNIPTANFTQRINQIKDHSFTSPNYTLPAGSYVMSVELYVTNTLENTNTGLNSTTVHRHVYEGRIADSGGNQLGDSHTITALSRTGTNARDHRINFIVPFKLSATTTLTPQLRRLTGSTYGNNLGGTGANNGQLIITYGIIDIKKL